VVPREGGGRSALDFWAFYLHSPTASSCVSFSSKHRNPGAAGTCICSPSLALERTVHLLVFTMP
jgi:hypothetical protein